MIENGTLTAVSDKLQQLSDLDTVNGKEGPSYGGIRLINDEFFFTVQWIRWFLALDTVTVFGKPGLNNKRSL